MSGSIPMDDMDWDDDNWECQLSSSLCNECGEPILAHHDVYEDAEGSWHRDCAINSGEVDY